MSFAKTKESEEMTNVIGMPTSQPTGPTGKIEAYLGRGSKVVGTLTFSGPVELDGQVEGEVSAQDKLTIGESAVVTGKIHGIEVLVRGTVNGDIVATKKLSLKKPAKILGNISSANISIEEGVIFEGKCTMGAAAGSEVKNFPGRQVAEKTSA